tara:strand:+ start:2353 stop:2484 length:132 start_codon:yes stop_codon:yes gene_type:complete
MNEMEMLRRIFKVKKSLDVDLDEVIRLEGGIESLYSILINELK